MTPARDLLAAAAAELTAAGVPSPRVDAELLLAHATGRPRALLGMAGLALTESDRLRFEDLVTQRSRRIPLQILTGRAAFRHLELAVGPGVFIPRPETELLVDHVLRFARTVGPQHAARPPQGVRPGRRPEPDGLLVVDLCAGSGAVALSVATELARSRVLAVEVSPAALNWAERNRAECAAQVSAVGSHLELIEADATQVGQAEGVLAAYRSQVDIVVTNPPYVPQDAVPREPEVHDHDPVLALYGGPDGLSIIRDLIDQAASLLRPGGLLVIEHADVQGEAAGSLGVPGVLRAHRRSQPTRSTGLPATASRVSAASEADCPWRDVVDHLDLAGRPRHTWARRA